MQSKQQIIIFIGPDRCGKTEIAKELSRQLEIPYFKNERQDRFFLDGKDMIDILHSDGDFALRFLRDTGYSIIRDREFPCEFVYARAFGRKTDEEFIFYLDEEYAKLNTLFVYCFKDEYKDFRDEYIKKEKVKELREGYELFMRKSKNQFVTIETSDENLEGQINFIKGVLS